MRPCSTSTMEPKMMMAYAAPPLTPTLLPQLLLVPQPAAPALHLHRSKPQPSPSGPFPFSSSTRSLAFPLALSPPFVPMAPSSTSLASSFPHLILGLLQCNQQHQNNWKNPLCTNCWYVVFPYEYHNIHCSNKIWFNKENNHFLRNSKLN